MLTAQERINCEALGDGIEQLARRCEHEGLFSKQQVQEALAVAWDFKQAARKSTPSEGV